MPNKKINALDVRTAVATDLMLVGDPTSGTAYKSTLATLPLVPTSRTLTINGVAFDLSANRAWTLGTVTSVGLSMPSAFGVANSPVTSSGTLAVTALGSASQYIRGDGVLATLPTGGSGGSSVSYYLNGGTAASVGTYFQMSTIAVVGTNVDFTRTGNGLVSQFLTDVGDPNRLQIPAGNWNFEMFFSMSSSGGTPEFYVELLKYDGTTFTSIASSSAIPETISSGTAIDLYLTSLAIPATTLLVTDRLALRVYIVNNSGGRTATLHTQDSHLCQIITNFAGGVSALNGLTANTQYFATGTSGTNFGIVSSGDTHTFNLPTASATNRGALSSADWTTFAAKQAALTLTTTGTSGAATLVGATLNIPQYSGGGSMAIGGSITSATAGSVLFAGTSGVLQQDNANLFWDDTNNRLGIGYNIPTGKLDIENDAVNDGGQLGSELTTTGSGTNWAGSGFATGYTHTTGSVIALTTSLAAVNGNKYQLTYTITGRTTGSVVIAYGGYTSGNITLTGSAAIAATATSSFSITPTTDFNGTIVMSIKQVIAGSATIVLRNSSGTITNEIRSSSLNTNLFQGTNSGSFVTTGYANLSYGTSSLFNNITGYENVAIGFESLLSVTQTNANIAIGAYALRNHTTSDTNIAIGRDAMRNKTTGNNSVAIGFGSQINNTGALNVSVGATSMAGGSGSGNTAIGHASMNLISSSALENTAIGYNSLGYSASFTGSRNVAIGTHAAGQVTSSNDSVVIGANALVFQTTGSNNVAIGSDAGRRISGGSNNTITNNSIFIGYDTRPLAISQTNQIVIGYQETGLGSNTTIIGNSSTITTAIRGRLILGTTTDSGLYQADINGSARVSGDALVNGLTIGKGNGSLSENSAFGFTALANDTGNFHAAFGYLALNANTTGLANTAIGRRSMVKNTSGNYNSAIGSNALENNLSGSNNMAMGSAALITNTTGGNNVAIGRTALYTNNGPSNVAIGFEAMYSNSAGGYNTAIGHGSLRQNNTDGNVAIGYIALNKATSAYNTATGFAASFENTSGTKNTSYGSESLKNISTSSNNTAIGANSGRYISSGTTANTTSANSTYLGSESRASADGNTNEIVIGYNTIGEGSNSVTLGNTSITKTILRGTINAANLPTSPTGLSTGDIWNNLGVLSIV